MLETAQNFERTAGQFNAIILIGPGLICVLVGLFVWLGGLGFRRILAAVAGAVSGGICGFFMTGRNIMLTIILAIAAAVIAIVIERIYTAIVGAGFFFRRLVPALCCAALGTILIFAGMILLLLHKGSMPVSYISSRQPFYAVVFAAMIAFGTIEQLLFCRCAGKKSIAKKETSKGKQETSKPLSNWRNK